MRTQARDGDGKQQQTLTWVHERTLQKGEVCAEITSAAFGDARRGYSIVVARQLDGRVSKFLRPQDLDDLEKLLPEIRDFIAAARAR